MVWALCFRLYTHALPAFVRMTMVDSWCSRTIGQLLWRHVSIVPSLENTHSILMRFREWHMWSQRIWYMLLSRHPGEWRWHIAFCLSSICIVKNFTALLQWIVFSQPYNRLCFLLHAHHHGNCNSGSVSYRSKHITYVHAVCAKRRVCVCVCVCVCV